MKYYFVLISLLLKLAGYSQVINYENVYREYLDSSGGGTRVTSIGCYYVAGSDSVIIYNVGPIYSKTDLETFQPVDLLRINDKFVIIFSNEKFRRSKFTDSIDTILSPYLRVDLPLLDSKTNTISLPITETNFLLLKVKSGKIIYREYVRF